MVRSVPNSDRNSIQPTTQSRQPVRPPDPQFCTSPGAGGPLQLRLPRCGLAGVAASPSCPCARREAACHPRAARERRVPRAASGARGHPRPPPRGSSHRSAPLDGGHRGIARPCARARRRATCRRDTTDAPEPDPALDGRTVGEGGRAVSFSVLRAVQPRSGCRADGVFARLAYGLGTEHAPADRQRRRRNCGTRRLRLRKGIQCRIHLLCRTAAGAVCARAKEPATLTASTLRNGHAGRPEA